MSRARRARGVRRHRWAAGAAVAALLLTSCAAAQDAARHPGASGPSGGSQPTSPRQSDTTIGVQPGLPPGFGAGPPGTGLARFYHQHVTWRPCGSGTDTCAAVWVPLDYHHPDGRAITIRAMRQPALDQAHKLGSLFINPGGPGESGIDYVSYISLRPDVTDRYDVIGFDPRGVGQSTAIRCLPAHQLDVFLAADPSPDTPAEVQRMVALTKGFERACQAHAGPLLAHVSTNETARDLDILRALVHDPTLNYYGASYGTYLGATYAALFPKRVGRMVLDGAVDPLSTPHEAEVNQAAGFQTALTAYLENCVAGGNCPLGSSVAVAQRQIIALFHRIDAHPLPTSSGRPLTEGLAFLGFVVPLYSRAAWPTETDALEQAMEGHGDTLLLLSDEYADRTQSGRYLSNALEAQPAISCLDSPEHETLAQIEAGRATFVKASPVFGPVAMWWPLTCSTWPVKPSLPKPDFAAPGAAPIVVVGTTRDPATPYQQAVRLSQELDSGVLLTRVGDGHTAYSSGNDCIDTAVDSYLTTGTPPAPGTRC